MKQLYEKLYDECKKSVYFQKDAHFVAMQGEYYQENSRKFMLIGRAPNGWESLNVNSKEEFGERAETQFRNTDRWNWIESVNGTLYSTHDRNISNLSKRYCVDKKAYWAYTKKIWEQLPGKIHEDEIWQKNIVWSNLYKVSPKESDNPDWKSMQIQQGTCIEILRKELEIFEPTHILIITGFDWFEPFAGIFSDVYDTGKRNVARGKNKNEVYVEGTAMYGTAKVVIACRPEWRDSVTYVKTITDEFIIKK